MRKFSDRQMYQNFLAYATVQRRAHNVSRAPAKQTKDLRSTLKYFDKLALHTALLHVAQIKKCVKTNFTSKQVESWTKLKGAPIAVVMGEVKRKLGGSAVLATVCGVSRDAALDNDIDPIHLTLTTWENAIGSMKAKEIRELVLRVKEESAAEGKLDVSWKELKKLKSAQSIPPNTYTDESSSTTPTES